MDPDVKIMFCAGTGELVPEERTLVKVAREFNRKSLPEDETSIDAIWKFRLKENPRLFNGTKFRVHSVVFDIDRKLTLNLGLTDYREYLGTNWASDVEQLRSRGQKDFSNPQAFFSDPMGVGAFVLTDDNHVVFLRRSLHCAEAPGMWDVPGGHAEPEVAAASSSLYVLMAGVGDGKEFSIQKLCIWGQKRYQKLLLTGIKKKRLSAKRCMCIIVCIQDYVHNDISIHIYIYTHPIVLNVCSRSKLVYIYL